MRQIFLWLETIVLLYTFSITIYQYTIETPSTHANDHKSLYSKHILATFLILYIVIDGRALRRGTACVFALVLLFDVLFLVELILFNGGYILELIAGIAHIVLSTCYVFWSLIK